MNRLDPAGAQEVKAVSAIVRGQKHSLIRRRGIQANGPMAHDPPDFTGPFTNVAALLQATTNGTRPRPVPSHAKCEASEIRNDMSDALAQSSVHLSIVYYLR